VAPRDGGDAVERIIVTVKRANEQRVRDVELAVHVPAEQLAEALAQKFGWDHDSNGGQVVYKIEAYPPGRALNPGETLAEADTWDGAWLVLHPEAGASATPPAQPAPAAPARPAGQGPLIGFTPLDGAPAESEGHAAPPANGTPPPGSGYTWKRVDPD
jgi:hypothetical protein